MNRKQDNWEDLCQAIRLGCDIHVLDEIHAIEGSSTSSILDGRGESLGWKEQKSTF